MSPLYQRLVEEDMCFDFDDGWTHVIAWDDEAAYRKGIGKIDGTRAIDFIGIYKKTLFFIEAKDYRPHRTPKGRSKPEDPWVELELKIRHTVAGLVGAHRQGCYDKTCGPIMKALFERRKLKLIYWLDEPARSGTLDGSAEDRRRAGASFYMQRFKKHLKWLDARIASTSSAEDYNKVLPGVRATSLPQDLRARATLVTTTLAERGMEVPEEVQRRLDAWSHGNRRKEINECLCRVPFISSARQLIERRK